MPYFHYLSILHQMTSLIFVYATVLVYNCCHIMLEYFVTVNSSQNTTFNINYALQQHVSTQMSHHQATFKTTFKVYKVTVHIWDPKGAQLLCTP
jgi:hypothetical protein